jgi:hypothetical protein
MEKYIVELEALVALFEKCNYSIKPNHLSFDYEAVYKDRILTLFRQAGIKISETELYGDGLKNYLCILKTQYDH